MKARRGFEGARAIALVFAAIALVAAMPKAKAREGEEAIPTLPIAIAVADATDDAGADDAGSRPAQTDAWIDAQIAEATRLFAKFAGVRFAKVASRAIDAKHAHLETRADRDALAALLRPGVINVFVVASLRDVDEPDRMRMGVCWSPRGNQTTRFVAISSIAKPAVLAHELGHYHGLPHSKTRNNVMSYDRDGGEPFFDALQIRTIRSSARDYVRAGILDVRLAPFTSAGSSGATSPSRDSGR